MYLCARESPVQHIHSFTHVTSRGLCEMSLSRFKYILLSGVLCLLCSFFPSPNPEMYSPKSDRTNRMVLAFGEFPFRSFVIIAYYPVAKHGNFPFFFPTFGQMEVDARLLLNCLVYYSLRHFNFTEWQMCDNNDEQ